MARKFRNHKEINQDRWNMLYEDIVTTKYPNRVFSTEEEIDELFHEIDLEYNKAKVNIKYN